MLIVEKQVLEPAGGHPREFDNRHSRYFF